MWPNDGLGLTTKKFVDPLFCARPTRSPILSYYLPKALKWHPDKNRDDPKKAEGRFKIVSEAYEVRANCVD